MSAVSYAAVIVSVDMDLASPGIQSTLETTPGSNVSFGLVLSLTSPTSLSAYNLSFRYDNSELTYVTGSRQEFASNVPVTGGGAFSETDTANQLSPFSIVGVPGLVLSRFDGVTTGQGPTGPFGPVLIAQASFTATAPVGNASDIDVLPGLFEAAFNENFDNSSNLLLGSDFVFNGGSLTLSTIPEPTSLLLMSFAGFGLTFARRRKLAA